VWFFDGPPQDVGGLDGQGEQVGLLWVFLLDWRPPESLFGRARETREHRHIMSSVSTWGFAGRYAPGNGCAVASANSDNSYLPSHPVSGQVAQKTCPETSRMIQNLVRPRPGAEVRRDWGLGAASAWLRVLPPLAPAPVYVLLRESIKAAHVLARSIHAYAGQPRRDLG